MKIKKVFSPYIPVLIFIITILSCKKSNTSFNEILESGNLDRIELKRTEIVKNQQEIYNKLKIIDKKIDELNGDKNTTIVETIVLKHERFDHYVNLQGSVKSNNLINIFLNFQAFKKNICKKW